MKEKETFKVNKCDVALLIIGVAVWALGKVQEGIEQKQLDDYLDEKIDERLKQERKES